MHGTLAIEVRLDGKTVFPSRPKSSTLSASSKANISEKIINRVAEAVASYADVTQPGRSCISFSGLQPLKAEVQGYGRPTNGQIYTDRKVMATLDPNELRRMTLLRSSAHAGREESLPVAQFGCRLCRCISDKESPNLSDSSTRC